MTLTHADRVVLALARLGFENESQAQGAGISFHPASAPLEVRALLRGEEDDSAEAGEPVDEYEEPSEDEVPDQYEPEQVEAPVAWVEVDGKPVNPAAPFSDPDGDGVVEGDDEGSFEPAAEDDGEDEEPAPNPATGITVDAFIEVAKGLTDAELTAALADTRKGIQVVAQETLDERA